MKGGRRGDLPTGVSSERERYQDINYRWGGLRSFVAWAYKHKIIRYKKTRTQLK